MLLLVTERAAETQRTDPDAEDTPPSRLRKWIQNTVPWVGAALILGFLFQEVPFREVWRAASQARLDLFAPAILVAVGYWFALDSRALAYLFTRFNISLTWAEARSLRGVTYLVAAINWNIGTAAIIFHLKRSKQIPALQSTGSLLFYQAFDGLLLMGLALLGSLAFTDSAAIDTIRRFALGAVLFQALALVFLMGSKPNWAWVERLRGASLVRSFRMVQPRDFLVLGAFRLGYFLGFITVFWAGAYAFGISIPPLLALASTPPILMAAGLPITPAGLGTQAAAMLFFWSEYGGKAEILAFGLVFPVALTLTRCLLGLFYVKDLRELRRPN